MDNKPPIGRYIAVAVIFILLFIGVAYLAYRVSRNKAGNVVTLPSPTPVATQVVTNGGGSTFIPAPRIPASNLNTDRIYTNPAPIATYVPALTNTATNQRYAFVAQDAQGNLLFDNLTHQENYQLQQQRLTGDIDYRLALLDRNASLETLKLNQQLQRDQLALNAAGQRDTRSAEAQNQLNNLNTQLALAKMQYGQQLASAQLEANSQLALAKQQTLTQQAQADSNYRLAQLNQQAELAKLSTQSATQLNQQTLAAKQEIVQRALEMAQQEKNNEYQLLATKLQGELAATQSDQAFQQQYYLTAQQAQIQSDLLTLQAYLNRQNSWSYGNYSPYNYSNYGYYPYY